MSQDLTDLPSPEERLRTFLDAVPFPWPQDANLDRPAKRLARDIEALALAGPKITVQVLSSFLTDYLVNHLVLMFARRGFAASIRQGEYGLMAAAILDDSHAIHADPPDVFLILPSFRDLSHCPALGATPQDSDQAVEAEVSFWQSLWARLPAPVVQLSFDMPAMRTLGELDGFTPGGLTHHARHINLALATQLPASVTLVDADMLARDVGLSTWHDPQVYAMCKQPFGFAALPYVADALSAAAAGLLGKGRRVFVVDLDHTMWGGIIGDDGLENIELGPETPEGEAFTAFQNYILQLRARGVILAVCSKNADETARLPFREHPAMVLKESDFASFVANFDDKPSNVRRIADELNLGLDSFVFVDDNPVERALMRRELPQVMTVELPENPALYASAVEACRAFPLAHLTADDLNRAESYGARKQTQRAMASASDMDGFLASLEAQAFVEPFAPASQDRIVQLLAKTNQFKLNPQTFTGEMLEQCPDNVIALRLKDRMQDYGIVAVAVLSTIPDAEDTMMIQNWVMSCRVFSRRLEYVMFEEIRRHAKHNGAARIELTYTPSGRNALIAELLPKLGFEATGFDDRFSQIVHDLGSMNSSFPAHHMDIVRPDPMIREFP